jgi:hypothetical protein
MRLKKIVAIWGMLALLMFFNGALRVGVLIPLFGQASGEMMSAFLGIIIVFSASRPYLEREAPMVGRQVMRVSAIWLALTVLFETGLGLMAGQSWTDMARSYALWVSVGAAPFMWLRRPNLRLVGLPK